MMSPAHALGVFSAAALSGLLGALTGLGGGLVLTPVLVLFLGVPLKYALGTSLISTIATSSGAASAYVTDELSNMKLGISLEIGTTAGAIAGALALSFLESRGWLGPIAGLFGVVLIASAGVNLLMAGTERRVQAEPDRFSRALGLHGRYYDEALGREVSYSARRYPWGLLGMFVAGALSGLLGIGSGAFKVLSMDFVMGLPFKISTATSNFMIGVTAATSAGLYWKEGFISPLVVAAAIPGILSGAFLGARFLNKMMSSRLRQIFTAVLMTLGLELIWKGIHGAL